MSTFTVTGYLPGITSEQLGAKATTASIRSERSSARTSSAPRRHHAEDSLTGVWLMIGTILGCLAIMITVVVSAAISVS